MRVPWAGHHWCFAPHSAHGSLLYGNGLLLCQEPERLHDWFVGKSLYEKRLEGLVARRAMTMTDKLRVVWSVTLVMGIGFVLMGKVPVGRAIRAVVWMYRQLYFFLRVQTLPEGQAPEGE